MPTPPTNPIRGAGGLTFARAHILVSVEIDTDTTEKAVALCRAVADPVVAPALVEFRRGTSSTVRLGVGAPTAAGLPGAASEVIAALLNAFRTEMQHFEPARPTAAPAGSDAHGPIDAYRATRCIDRPCRCACHSGGPLHGNNHCDRAAPRV
jgi:hypothetical protein